MHRISCFGAVDQSTTATYQLYYRLWAESVLVLPAIPLSIIFVKGAPGPRYEKLEKGASIKGFPGGTVNDVNHKFISGACLPDCSSGYAGLYAFSNSLVVPVCNSVFSMPCGLETRPTLSRGEGKAILLEVSLEDGISPAGKPYTVRVVFQFWAHSSDPSPDEYLSWTSQMYLNCPHDDFGNYRVLESVAPPGGAGLSSWVVRSKLLPYDPWIVRSDSLRVNSNSASSFETSPPYLPSLEKFWEKEAQNLDSCNIAADRVRDCTLDALDQATFTDALTLSNLKDVLEAVSTVKSTLLLYKDFRTALKKMNPMLLLKVVASAHLVWRYVIKTTSSDLKELCELGQKLWEHRVAWWDYLTMACGRSSQEYSYTAQPSGRVYSSTMNLRLQMRPAQYQMISYLRTVGLSPDLAGFWDLIPFSFVVDWVLPIGDTIDAANALYDLQNVDCCFVTSLKSQRLIHEVICPGVILAGQAQRYQRVVSRSYAGSSATTGLRFRNPIKNLWTGLALIVASITRR